MSSSASGKSIEILHITRPVDLDQIIKMVQATEEFRLTIAALPWDRFE